MSETCATRCILWYFLAFASIMPDNAHSVNVLSDIFARSFGRQKISALFPTNIDLVNAVWYQENKTAGSVDPNCAALYVGCVQARWQHEDTDRPVEAETALRTLFISDIDDLQCYLLRCNQSSLEGFKSQHGMKIVGAVPSVLKIDVALLQLLKSLPRPPLSTGKFGKSINIRIKCWDAVESSNKLVLQWFTELVNLEHIGLVAYFYDPTGLNSGRVRAAVRYTNGKNDLRAHRKLHRKDDSESRSNTRGFSKLVSRLKRIAKLAELPAFLKNCVDEVADIVQSRREGQYIELNLRPKNAAYLKDMDSVVCLTLFLIVIAEDPVVGSVGLSPTYKLANDVTKGLVQSGQPYREIYTDLGLNGSDEVVGVADTGIDSASCFVREEDQNSELLELPVSNANASFYDKQRRKIIQYIDYGDRFDYEKGHGSHVVGTIAGHCIECEGTGLSKQSMESYNGVAPAAKISFFDIGSAGGILNIPLDAAVLLRPSYDSGARVFSVSWGGDFTYDGFTISVDEFVYEHPEFLFVAAAGNDGGHGPHSVISPGLAKNALTIGASNTPRSAEQSRLEVAQFSSFGPTPDGRIKPDVVAPGHSTFSMRAGAEGIIERTCDVVSKAGTSMATPAASGASALVRQYFRDGAFWSSLCNNSHGLCRDAPFSPPGYLVKAVMIHSGDSLYEEEVTVPTSKVAGGDESLLSTAPDCTEFLCRSYKEGFGVINLANVLSLRAKRTDLYVSLSQLRSYEQHLYRLYCDGSSHLKITLSWYDPPNIEFSAILLINDLDLIVSHPNGEEVLGNHLFSSVTDNIGPDKVNNIEQILISDPYPGFWIVAVRSKLLCRSSPFQNFSVVVTGAVYVEDMGVSQDSRNGSGASCISNLQHDDEAATENVDIVLFNYGREKIVLDDVTDSAIVYKLSPDFSKCADVYGIDACFEMTSYAESIETARFLFDNSYFYNLQSLCLGAGHYIVEYSRERNGILESLSAYNISYPPYAELETMLSIPQCSSFLSPLVSEQIVRLSVDETSDSAGNVLKLDCGIICATSDHISIPLYLFNGYWIGSHFVVSNLKSEEILSGKSLELNYDEVSELCLPAVPACYHMKLFVAHSPAPGPVDSSDDVLDDQPYIFLYDSYNYSRAFGVLKNESCPYFLQSGAEDVSICTDGYSVAYYDFGYSPTSRSTTGDRVCIGSVQFLSRRSTVSLRMVSSDTTSLEWMSGCISYAINDISTLSPIQFEQDHIALFLDSLEFSCRVLRHIFPEDVSELRNESYGFYSDTFLQLNDTKSCMYGDFGVDVQDMCLLLSYFRQACVPDAVELRSSVEDRIFDIRAEVLLCTSRFTASTAPLPNFDPTVAPIFQPCDDCEGADIGRSSASTRYIMYSITVLSVLLLILAYYCFSRYDKRSWFPRKRLSMRVFSNREEYILSRRMKNSTDQEGSIVDFGQDYENAGAEESINETESAIGRKKRRIKVPEILRNGVLSSQPRKKGEYTFVTSEA